MKQDCNRNEVQNRAGKKMFCGGVQILSRKRKISAMVRYWGISIEKSCKKYINKWLLYHRHVSAQKSFIQLCLLFCINCLSVTIFSDFFFLFLATFDCSVVYFMYFWVCFFSAALSMYEYMNWNGCRQMEFLH